MRIKNLPRTNWDIDNYNLEYYGYGDVGVFIDESKEKGEIVWCIFRIKDIKKYEDDKCYDKTFAILCNDCGVKFELLEGLNAGQIVPIQFSGDKDPVIPLDWVNAQFWRI